jgi:hypothetical protein
LSQEKETSNMSSLNTVKLKEIATANATAMVVYAALKSRKRARNVTDLRQFQARLEGQGVNNDDYYAFFKGLEEAGAGSMVFRRGKPPRFKWSFSLKDVVGEAGTKKPPAKVVHMQAKPSPAPVDAITHPTEESQVAVAEIPPTNLRSLPIKAKMQVSIILARASGDEISIKLPADLSHAEAQEIGDLIKGMR